MGVTRRWTRWVDLKVAAQSRSGSLIGRVNRFVGLWHDLASAGVRLVGAWMCDQSSHRCLDVRSERSACERGWRVLSNYVRSA